MDKQDEMLKKAVEVLAEEGIPSVQQKDRMLEHILMEKKAEDTAIMKWKRLIVTYPWRFALTVSVTQAVVFTLIYGTKYTNLFLNYFGG